MALNLPDRAVTATSNDKSVHTKTVQLLAADFAVGGTASIKAILPADSSILGMTFWKKTQFAGGGVTALSLSVGVPGAITQFVVALDALTPAASTQAIITPITNIMQNYSLPLGPDISLLFTGVATTGAPTSGEAYVTIHYVR